MADTAARGRGASHDHPNWKESARQYTSSVPVVSGKGHSARSMSEASQKPSGRCTWLSALAIAWILPTYLAGRVRAPQRRWGQRR